MALESVPNDRIAPSEFDFDDPLRPIVAEWMSKIRLAQDFKKKQFGDAAEECMTFYNGAMDALYDLAKLKKSDGFRMNESGQDWPAPTFQLQANKVNECVGLFGPVLYHKEPYRQVNPRKKPELPPELYAALAPQNPQSLLVGPDPQTQMLTAATQALYEQQAQRRETLDKAGAKLLEYYLNYTPRECGLKDEARLAIDEALIKGCGTLWVEVVQPVYGPKLVSSFYDTVDNLVLDPDAENMKDCKWIARRCTHPVWEVERLYNLPRGSLKATLESYHRQSTVNSDDMNGDYNRKRGVTNDLLVYWKIYSKMGVGGRLTGVDKKYRDVLDQFGDYAFLVIAPDIPYPLNLPSDKLKGSPEDALQALDWPTPFWTDGKWPMVPLYFRTVPRQLWPMAHFTPAMGYLKAINWVYSMAISKVGITCRDFIAMLKSASQDVKDAILHGRDFSMIEIPATGPQGVNDYVQFLQHPSMQADVWRILDMLKLEFDKATGLSELVYGMSSHQMRSAQEANLKGDQISVRPDDMANKVEDWASAVARNEAVAIAWNVGVADVEPILGKAAAALWGMLVVSTDPCEVLGKLECGIEAGSTKKPNKDRDAANMQMAMQNLFQPFFMVAQATAFVKPINALIGDWCKSLDLDPTAYLFPDLPPPPPPGPPGGGAPGGGTGDGSQQQAKEPAPQGDPQAQAQPGPLTAAAAPMPNGPPAMNVGLF